MFKIFHIIKFMLISMYFPYFEVYAFKNQIYCKQSEAYD